MKPTAVIVFRRFGPYHLTRIRSAADLFGLRGFRLVGLEVASTDHTYAWAVERGDVGFERLTLFPGANYDRLTAQQVSAALGRTLDRLDPCAVAINGWYFACALAAVQWCRKRERAAVLMSESQEHDHPRRLWAEWVKRERVALFDSALVGGSRHLSYCEKLGMVGESVFTGYDVVDSEYFCQASKSRRGDPTSRKDLGLPERFFLTVARLTCEKNLARTMGAYAAYRADAGTHAWDWVVCGDGPLRGCLLQLRQTHGLSDHVAFPGFVQLDGLPSYYAHADALLLPSIKEPWGLVVNEAMASGLPVVVSRACGCAEDLVEEGANGFTFDPLSPDAIKEALLAMHQTSEAQRQEMGLRSRSLISEWSPARFAEGLWRAVELGTQCATQRRRWKDILGILLSHPQLSL